MKSDNLVIVRAGKDSLHPGWMEQGGVRPAFDLLVAAYHKDAVSEDAPGIRYRLIPGSKVRGWNAVLREQADLVRRYQHVALIDDDIEADAATLNRCFAVGKAHDLSLWQPSLTHDSFATYGASLQNDRFLLRHVNCIEMMCPFFKVATLTHIAELFSLGYESGIDLVWCSLVRELGGKCAIVDACAVRHTKPVGEQKQLNGFIGKTYEDDIRECLNLFGMEWPSWVAESAIDKSDHTKIDGFNLKFNTMRPLLSFLRAPKGNRLDRLKASFDHVRHQALRQPYYGIDIKKRIDRLKIMAR